MQLLWLLISGFVGWSFLVPITNSSAGYNHWSATAVDTLIQSNNALETDSDITVDSVIRSYLSANNISNLAVGLISGADSFSYGYAKKSSVELPVPTDKSIFEIGSLTKTFSATLLAKLVNEGRVDANDPVSQYLPDSIPLLQYNGKPITLMHLVNHSSGLPRLPLNILLSSNRSDPYSHYDKKALFYYLKSVKLRREPGTVYEYSNLGMGLLGVVLEDISGKLYETLLVEHIAGPLKMNYTRQHISPEHMVPGFNALDQPTPVWNFQALAAAGCLRSCIADLLLYTKAQLRPPTNALGKAIELTQQSSFKQGHSEVAMGWHVLTIRENQYLVHEGQTGGYSSIIVFNRATQNAVVILVNGIASPGKPALQMIHWLDNNKTG